MSTLRKVWGWTVDHGWLFFFVLLAAVVYILGRGKTWPQEAIETEIEAVRARRATIETIARGGVKVAQQEIRERHAAELRALDAEQTQQAVGLAEDPAALSEFLVRAGRRARRKGAP